jgi:hypothetical protein
LLVINTGSGSLFKVDPATGIAIQVDLAAMS